MPDNQEQTSKELDAQKGDDLSDKVSKRLVRVTYRDYNDGIWDVTVIASTHEDAEALVTKESDCKKVLYSN